MRKSKVRQVTQEVAAVQEQIDGALNEGIVIPYDGKDNFMANEAEQFAPNAEALREDAPANVDPTVVDPNVPAEAAPAPEVDVVVVQDSEKEEVKGRDAERAQDAASLERIDDLRAFTLEELQAMGIPASSIPRNAATTAPDRVSENAAEEQQIAAESPTNSYEVESNGAEDDEVVG
jgi:hypothetical protein